MASSKAKTKQTAESRKNDPEDRAKKKDNFVLGLKKEAARVSKESPTYKSSSFWR